jgi:hypothetical protein
VVSGIVRIVVVVWFGFALGSCNRTAMAPLSYTTTSRKVTLSATVLAWPSCEHCLLVLFDAPARLHTVLSRPRGLDTVLPDRNGMSARDVADRKYNAHWKGFCSAN